MKVLTFSIDNTNYAISIATILQVIREKSVVDMPYSTVWFEGIIQYKEMIIPILNLRKNLQGHSQNLIDKGLQRTIVLRVNGHPIGLVADQTQGVVSIDEETIEDFAHLSDRPVYITGAFHAGEKFIFMIDPEKFFSEEFNREVEKIETFHEKSMGRNNYEKVS